MPILDPSLQYSLSNFDLSTLDQGNDFFITYLEIASNNVFRSIDSLQYSVQFKNHLETNYAILNKQYSCNFSKDNFTTSTLKNTYQFLISSISSKIKDIHSPQNYFSYSGEYFLNFYIPFSNSDHTWYLTDSSIAILAFHPDSDFSCEMINLEVDLMLVSGFTIVLCVLINISNSKVIKNMDEFLSKTVKTCQFSEIHFNLEFNEIDKTISKYESVLESIKTISSDIKSFFYIYCPFFEDYSMKNFKILSELREKPFFKIFCFSKNLKDSLKHTNNNFFRTQPFKYCKSGFEIDKIRITLCNIPLYASEDDETDIVPSNESDVTIGYIFPKDFLNWSQIRVPILLEDKFDNHRLINSYIDFDDLHIIRPDFYVKKTLYLTRTDSEILNIIDEIARDFGSSKAKNKTSKRSEKNKIKNAMEDVITEFYKHENKNFELHQSQIFTAFEACKACLFKEKKKDKTDHIRVLYQVETGEGKSIIISLIAAVLLKIMKCKVHIASSNIFLSKRDYEKSFDFFKGLNLKSGVLLHQNELPEKDSDTRIKYYSKNEQFEYDFFNSDLFKNSLKMNYDICGIVNIDEITNVNIPTQQSADIIYSTFVNFESFYLRITEMYSGKNSEYFDKCVLLIDEADSILIDELTNGTILSRPVNSNVSDVLIYVYLCKENGKNVEQTWKEVLYKWPNCIDLTLDDVHQMYSEIDIVNQDEFENGKKYFIETCKIKNKQKGKKKMKNINDSVKKMKHFMKNFCFKKDNKEEEEEEENNLVPFDIENSDVDEYTRIVPFDYDNKGVLEPNKEFSGFIQQFIAIKEMIKSSKENEKINMKIKDISLEYLYISHPIFVKMYRRVSAFTGTIGNKFCKELLAERYQITTKEISRNEPNCRIDLPVFLCNDVTKRNELIINDILAFSEKGNPVLVIFQNLNDIKSIEKILKKKLGKSFNVQSYNGSNENNKPDLKAGRFGAISLGTNFCGRGTNIEHPSKPLHVIISYFTTNDRVMMQAYGRTARQGDRGTVRIICLKNEYIQKVKIFQKEDMEKTLNDINKISELQHKYIEEFRSKRKWIFDNKIEPDNVYEYQDELNKMRSSMINVNRSKAYNVEFPLCMSVETFLKIQAQKIFSLYNCPDCTYTWMLFQRYVREMILESWSLFIHKKEHIINAIKNDNKDYYEKLEMARDILIQKVCEYIPNDVDEKKTKIIPTFIHIYNKVIDDWQEKILSSLPKFNCRKPPPKEIKKKVFYFGFLPFSLLDTSGARITTFGNQNEMNYFIEDPELKYIEKQKEGESSIKISITKSIDKLFNSICEKINQIISGYIGLKFFLRRTLGGCEFGLCFDFEFENSETTDEIGTNCIIDKDPLLVFLINVKSKNPVMAGILIFGLIYVLKLCLEIVQWVGEPMIKSIGFFLKKIKNLSLNLLSLEIEVALGKICSFLQKILQTQIEKLRMVKEYEKFTNLLYNLSKIVEMRHFNAESSTLNQLFSYKFRMKKSSTIGKFLMSNLPIGAFIKIGLLLLMCISSFLLNFRFNTRAVKYNCDAEAKEYKEDQNIDKICDKYDYTVKSLTVDGYFIIGKSQEDLKENDCLVFAERFIEKAVIPSEIKQICISAFKDCEKLESVEFKEDSKLEIIDQFSFNKTSITKIKIPSNVTQINEGSFSQCEKLKSIEFDKNSKLKVIEKDAFNGTLIEEIFIPENVDDLRAGCFNGMNNLKNISISSKNKFYSSINGKIIVKKSNEKDKNPSDIIFAERGINQTTVPSFMKRICESSFCNCQKLKIIKFEANSKLKKISKFAFFNSSIESIVIPANVSKIGQYAFCECKSLKSIKFEENSKLKKLKKFVFAKTAIENIVIPMNVTIIDENAFNECNSLKSIEFEDNSKLQIIAKDVSKKNIEFGSFNQVANLEKVLILNKNYATVEENKIIIQKIKEKSKFNGLLYACHNITEVTIPSFVKQICESAFSECLNLKTVKFEANSKLEIIDKYSFNHTSIESILIPSKVNEIGEFAFSECQSLKSVDFEKNSKLKRICKNSFSQTSTEKVVIPTNVTRIGKNAFFKCVNLKSIEFEENSKLQVIGRDAFNDTKIKEIFIPDEVEELQTGWLNGMSKLKSVKVSVYNKYYSLIYNDKLVVGRSDKDIDEIDCLIFARRDIKKIKIPKFIKRINESSFSNCKNLKLVEFEKDSELKVIDKYAFFNTSIEAIIIPRSVKEINEHAFTQCKKLKQIVFDLFSLLEEIKSNVFNEILIKEFIVPSGLIRIGQSAFYQSPTLRTVKYETPSILRYIDTDAFNGTLIDSISFPSSVARIGDRAFFHCPNLASIKFQQNSVLQFIGCDAFNGTLIEKVAIPSNVTRIAERAFSNCINLKVVLFGKDSKLHYIDNSAFNGTSIEKVVFPSSVVEIGEESFAQCNFLNSVEFDKNSNLESIKKEAFRGTLLEKVTIPSSCTEISEGSFSQCKQLKIIEFEKDSNLNSIGKNAFTGTSIEKVTIPSKVTSIGEAAFFNIQKLKTVEFEKDSNLNSIGKNAFSETPIEKVTIPSSCTEISEGSFSQCKQLKIVEFEKDSILNSIGKNAFNGTSIEKVTLPQSVTSIEEAAFFNCEKLEKLEMKSSHHLKSIGKDAFNGTPIESLCISNDIEKLEEGWCNGLKSLNSIYISVNKIYSYFGDKIVIENSDNKSSLVFAERDIDEEVSIPSFIVAVRESAFCYCQNLRTIKFEERSNLEIICKFAFAYTSIEEIVIPAKVTEICEGAFYRCQKLKSVKLAELTKLKKIGKDAFYGTLIESFAIPDSLEKLDEGWCNGIKYLNALSLSENNSVFQLIQNKILIEKNDTIVFAERDIREISIPSDIRIISQSSFYCCQSLRKVTFDENSNLEKIDKFAFFGTSIECIQIPKTVVEIADFAFSDCKNLKLIQFKDKSILQNIGEYAFSNILITEIIIPSEVARIEKGTFDQCKNLNSIKFDDKSKLEFIDKDAFNGTLINNDDIPAFANN